MFSHIVDKHTFAEFPQQNVFSHCGQTHFWRISPTKCVFTLWMNTRLMNLLNKMCSHIVDNQALSNLLNKVCSHIVDLQAFVEFPQQNMFSHCGRTSFYRISSTKCFLTLWTNKLLLNITQQNGCLVCDWLRLRGGWLTGPAVRLNDRPNRSPLPLEVGRLIYIQYNNCTLKV